MAKFKTGDIVRSKKNIDRDYKIVTVMADGLVETETLDSDKFVHTCRADILELVQAAPTDTFTLLDDEGRKALKAGDRVLVEFDVREVDNEDSTVLLAFSALRPWIFAKDIFALLPPAKKPIAVGDLVRIATQSGTKGKVLAFTSAGVPVVEFADGDGLTARAFDASCLKVIS